MGTDLLHLSTTTINMKAVLCLLSVLLLSNPSLAGVPRVENDLSCKICVDVVTDLATWITADTTMEEILGFTHKICGAIGSLLGDEVEAQCNAMFDENLPAIIKAIVEDNLQPQEVCNM